MVEILRHPTEEDWARCKALALNTIGRTYSDSKVSGEWKHKILRAGHSPIRTLMFTIRMEIPYWVSVHFVRHKFGVEHYVRSQRNDRQDVYDRTKSPQDMPVVHVMDLNAQALMNIIQMRTCEKADEETRRVAYEIANEVMGTNPEFAPFLLPKCTFMDRCNEFKSCGYHEELFGK